MSATTDYAAKTTKCPISRQEFRERAKPMRITLEYDGKTYTTEVQVKEYESGSLGWSLSDKWVPCLEGRDVKCQIGLNVTAIGSKELPKATAAAA